MQTQNNAEALFGIFIALVIGSIGYVFGALFFTTSQAILLGLIAFLVTLWSNEALPLGIVSLTPIILFPSFGILDTKLTAANYAHPIIYLFLGGFLLAIGVEKTKLHLYIAKKVLSFFPATPRAMIFSLAVTSALLSSFLSNTTTTLLLIPIAVFLTPHHGLKMRFALAIAYGASIGGILTPIGTPPNLILLGIMEENGMELIPFFQWMMLVAPLVIFMLVGMSFLLSLGTVGVSIQNHQEIPQLNTQQKKVLFVMFSLIALLVVNASIKPYWAGLGLSESGILLGAGMILFLPYFNILVWEEDAKKIPYAIMFLFGAGFSIAKAFTQTGLADQLATYLLHVTTFEPFFLLLFIATFITFTTEVTSNTALISIMLPVIYAVAQQSHIDTRLFMMVATVCGSYAFMLPIATAPNAIAMSSGAVHVKDMMRYGFILNIIGIFAIGIIAHYFWSNIL